MEEKDKKSLVLDTVRVYYSKERGVKKEAVDIKPNPSLEALPNFLPIYLETGS